MKSADPTTLPCLAIALLSLFTVSLSAEASGLFSYVTVGETVRITDYPTTAEGEVEIPAAIDERPVTAIGSQAFAYCDKVTQIIIPATVTHIGEFAFLGCHGLSSLTLPASITEIGDSAFTQCRRLGAIHVEPKAPNHRSIDGILYNAAGTTLIRCPEGRSGDLVVPVTVSNIASRRFLGAINGGYVGTGAFENCSALTHVALPDGVVEIGPQAFARAGMSTIELSPQLTKIGYFAFAASSLKTISIPDGVTTISYQAFADCAQLRRASFPQRLRRIESLAFHRCHALTQVIFPEELESIDSYAFANCSSLREAVFLGDAPHLSTATFLNASANFTIIYLSKRTGFGTPAWISFSRFKINETFFPAASWLLKSGLNFTTDLYRDTNGDGFPLINAYAFGLDPNADVEAGQPSPQFESITDTLDLIFHANSPGVNYSVETSDDLEHWETSEASLSDLNENNQRTASIPVNLGRRFLRLRLTTNSAKQAGPIIYRIINGEAIIVDYFKGTAGEVEIPNEIDGIPVTAIGDRTFFGHQGITSITLPTTVTHIGQEAFRACERLEAIHVPSDHPTYSSIDGVLFNLEQSELIRVPEGIVGAYTVPDQVAKIRSRVFDPEDGWIGTAAFEGCNFLSEVVIPEGVTELGPFTFSHCAKLRDVTLPDGLLTVGSHAFEHCLALPTLTLPKTVSTVGYGLFESCKSLVQLRFLGDAPNPPVAGWDAVFAGVSSFFSVHYTTGSIGFSAPRWQGLPSAEVQ